jgi:predicted nucleotidyltransferase
VNIQIINDIEIMGIVNTIINAVPAVAIYLFGSFAKGNAKEDSDYDFYVVIPDDGIRTREATWKIREELVGKQKRGIDMLVGTVSKFNKYKDSLSFIEREVVETGVKLYG